MTVKKVDLMKNVDVLERVNIRVFQYSPGNFKVTIEPIDQTQKVVFDDDSLKVFNKKITEKCMELSANDPKTRDYIKEYTARMFSELYRNGLAELVELDTPKQDPYEDLRHQYDHLNKN